MKKPILVGSLFMVSFALSYALNLLGGGPQLWVNNPGVDNSYGLTVLPGGIAKSPKELTRKKLFLEVSTYINPHCLFWRFRAYQLSNAKAGYNRELDSISVALSHLSSQHVVLGISDPSMMPKRVELQMAIDKTSHSLSEARPNVVRWCGPDQANAIFNRNP